MANCFKSGKKSNKLQKKPSTKGRRQPTQPTTPAAIADQPGPIERDFQENLEFSYITARNFDALTLELNSNDEWEWSGGHRLSAILEILSEKSRRDSGSVQDILDRYTAERPDLPTLNREYERLSKHLRTRPSYYNMSVSRSPERNEGRSPEPPKSIEAPPTDLETLARIEKSLVFEHFTTEDAWQLGSALRNRLLPIPTPVVISISLANQNQILFHTATHSGVMPDNDSWVARKRKTVLRWGVSTWYMQCKFKGDEKAFAEKYGLGADAGSYAIHGGGVPIRVVGVEGVVAVVVVSGLKQHEDHGVIVECIRELYY